MEAENRPAVGEGHCRRWGVERDGELVFYGDRRETLDTDDSGSRTAGVRGLSKSHALNNKLQITQNSNYYIY